MQWWFSIIFGKQIRQTKWMAMDWTMMLAVERAAKNKANCNQNCNKMNRERISTRKLKRAEEWCVATSGEWVFAG